MRGCPLNSTAGAVRCAPGDVGLDDQRLALEWVVEHIGSFGGNGSDIVLVGSGSGAWAVGAHLFGATATPWDQGFWDHPRFSKAILMSESPLRRYFSNRPENLSTSLRCLHDDEGLQLQCLRRASAWDIVRLTTDPSTFFGPTVTPSTAQAAATTGRRFFLGTVSDEGRLLVDYLMRTLGPDVDMAWKVNDLLSTVYGLNTSLDVIEGIQSRAAHENTSAAADDHWWASKLLGDVLYVCPLIRLAQQLAAEHRNKVFGYVFEHRASFALFNDSYGAGRFSELDFLFGRPLDGSRAATDEEKELSGFIMQTWAIFARTGSPPPADGKAWPAYSKRRAVHVAINLKKKKVMWDFKKNDCSLVDDLFPGAINTATTALRKSPKAAATSKPASEPAKAPG